MGEGVREGDGSVTQSRDFYCDQQVVYPKRTRKREGCPTWAWIGEGLPI